MKLEALAQRSARKDQSGWTVFALFLAVALVGFLGDRVYSYFDKKADESSTNNTEVKVLRQHVEDRDKQIDQNFSKLEAWMKTISDDLKELRRHEQR